MSLLRQAIAGSSRESDDSLIDISLFDSPVVNTPERATASPSPPSTPRTRMRKLIHSEFSVHIAVWPPTFDVNKYKGMLNHITWWHDQKKLVPLIGLFLGLILFIITKVSSTKADNEALEWTAATTVLMAVWWITEAVPLPATALLPIVIFPLAGVMSSEETAAYYMNSTDFLLIGGFILALTMEKWNLHRRIALKMSILLGLKPPRLMLGMMVATFITSMFVSNVAAVMMMLPNALQIVKDLENYLTPRSHKKFATGLLLGLAYSASIGGTATLVGSPPNLVFVKIFRMSFPNAPEITFANWLLFALPISVVLFALMYIYLLFIYCPREEVNVECSKFKRDYALLGAMKAEEIMVMSGILVTILLWLFRADISLGSFTIPGWSNLFPNPAHINDGTVAIFSSLLFFLCPARDFPKSSKHKHSARVEEEKVKGTKQWTSRLITWETASGIPWDVILLLGGGFALAAAFHSSGLAATIGSALSSFRGLPMWVTVLLISLVVHLLTEFTSNTATTQVTLPIIASLAVSIKVNPLMLMIPGVLSASLAFMMHIATAPNLVIFSTHRVHLATMVKSGFVLDLLSIVITTGGTFALVPAIYGGSWDSFPDWANTSSS